MQNFYLAVVLIPKVKKIKPTFHQKHTGNSSDNSSLSRILSLQEMSLPDWIDGISRTPDVLDMNCETICVSLRAEKKIWI